MGEKPRRIAGAEQICLGLAICTLEFALLSINVMTGIECPDGHGCVFFKQFLLGLLNGWVLTVSGFIGCFAKRLPGVLLHLAALFVTAIFAILHCISSILLIKIKVQYKWTDAVKIILVSLLYVSLVLQLASIIDSLRYGFGYIRSLGANNSTDVSRKNTETPLLSLLREPQRTFKV